MVLKLPTWKPIELYTAAVVLPSYGSVSDCTSRLRWSITDPCVDGRASVCALVAVECSDLLPRIDVPSEPPDTT